MNPRTLIFSISLASALVSASAIARDDGAMVDQSYRSYGRPSAEAMVVDALVARPLGIIATALGAVTWVVSLPFSLPSGSADEAASSLVGDPARYTFKRPLGEFPGQHERYHAYRDD